MIASDISKHLSDSMSPIEKVSVINDILYDNYNFRGDKKNYHSPENSSFGNRFFGNISYEKLNIDIF